MVSCGGYTPESEKKELHLRGFLLGGTKGDNMGNLICDTEEAENFFMQKLILLIVGTLHCVRIPTRKMTR